MRKDKSYFDKKAFTEPVIPQPEVEKVEQLSNPPVPVDSWTYQNMGPGGYIDAAGVPCSPMWRD
jgi:hypothetical protein